MTALLQINSINVSTVAWAGMPLRSARESILGACFRFHSDRGSNRYSPPSAPGAVWPFRQTRGTSVEAANGSAGRRTSLRNPGRAPFPGSGQLAIRTGRDKLTSRCLSAHQARQLAHGDQPRGHSQRYDRTKQETAKSLSRSVRGTCPNITLLDLTLPDMNDIDVLQTRCDSHPDPRIVDLTT